MITDTIRKFVGRLFGPVNRGPQRIASDKHGIDRRNVSRHAIKVCEVLRQHGYEAYIVGGAVRDLIMGLEPKDFDVATNATPEQIRPLFRRARIIGRRFQLVHVVFGQEIIETSTFRAPASADQETDEHGRILRDNVFGSQEEDAARRDFTMNALYYDPHTEEVIDYHNGVQDLKKRQIRMIGDPVKRYREDPVRMLRAVRFAAKLNGTIDPATRQPIRTMAALIENVPASRLFDEMLKLLTCGHAMDCLRQLRADGLHHGLLPLLDVVLEQPGGEHFVELALERTDARVRAGKTISPVSCSPPCSGSRSSRAGKNCAAAASTISPRWCRPPIPCWTNRPKSLPSSAASPRTCVKSGSCSRASSAVAARPPIA